jgi:drug/metabolite transporter (DMT)-like permease
MLFAYAQLALAMAMVGAVVALAKPLLAVFPLLILVTLRQLIASATLVGWVAASGGSLRPPPRGVWRPLLLQVVFGNFLFNLALLAGVARTGAIEAGLITSTLPAMIALLAWRMLGERVSVPTRIAVVLAIAGVALLELAGGHSGGENSLLGDGLVFLAVLFEALYTIYAKQLAGRVEPLQATMWANLIGLVLFLPLALFQVGDVAFGAIGLSDWLLLIVYALMASVFAFWLWYRGTVHVAAAKAGLFTALMPLTAVAVAIAALGETPTTVHAAGSLLLLASLVLAVRKA